MVGLALAAMVEAIPGHCPPPVSAIMPKVTTYRFSFVEHDNGGGPQTKAQSLDLIDVSPVFVRAVAKALREDPYVTNVKVLEISEQEREIDPLYQRIKPHCTT